MSHALRRRTETGFATLEWMVAATISFLFLVLLLNLIVVQYEKGYLQAAAEEGSRVGARFISDPEAACEAREAEVMKDMGKIAANPTHTCTVTAAPAVNGRANVKVQANAAATIAGWLPTVPTFNLTAHAVTDAAADPQ